MNKTDALYMKSVKDRLKAFNVFGKKAPVLFGNDGVERLVGIIDRQDTILKHVQSLAKEWEDSLSTLKEIPDVSWHNCTAMDLMALRNALREAPCHGELASGETCHVCSATG